MPLFVDNEDDYCDNTTNVKHKNGSKQIAQGVVYLDGLGDLADVTMGKKTLENTRDLKERVISADQLSGYLMVIVTFSRCGKKV